MAFDGTEGRVITLAQAAGMTQTYRQANPNSIKGVFLGKDLIEDILRQNGCMGVRAYFATDASGAETLVFVGADANEADMETGIVADQAAPCPPRCKQSQLNS